MRINHFNSLENFSNEKFLNVQNQFSQQKKQISKNFFDSLKSSFPSHENYFNKVRKNSFLKRENEKEQKVTTLKKNEFKIERHKEVKENQNIKQNKNLEKLRVASQQIEGIFLKILYKEMTKGLKKEGILKVNQGEKIFSDMLLDERVKLNTKHSPVGLSRLIYEQYKNFV